MESLISSYPELFKRPIQYTTRLPRDDSELDTYVFLTKPQFYTKLENGDFIEFTEYNWNLYAISVHINHSDSNIFIVEPVGKASLKKYFQQNDIPYRSYYLEIPTEVVKERMMNRGDTAQTINQRLKDFKYFSPEPNDKVLDATLPFERNVELIAKSNWAL